MGTTDYSCTLGLPGLLQTMAFNNREKSIQIYTPEGTRSELENFISISGSYGFKVQAQEISPPSTIVQTKDYTIDCFQTNTNDNSAGYTLVEEDRRGRFIREKAESLGVPEGPKFSRLHSGEAVELEDGQIINPEQVVGPPRVGRHIVYTGKTRPTETVADAAENADLLIHDAAYTNSHLKKAQSGGHSTAKQAGEIAAHSGAKRLALMHFSGRYESNDDHIDEADNAAPDTEVFGADDGQELQIQFPNAENEYVPKIELQEQEAKSSTIEDQLEGTAVDSPLQSIQQTIAATEHTKEAKRSQGTTSALAALRKQAEEEAQESVEVTTNSSPQRSTEYSRSKAVKEYVKTRASGYCEGCGDPAPFKSKTGDPYLHAHHVFELSGGGSDTPDTVIALCPNCHYRVHHGQDGKEYNEHLQEKVQQIETDILDA